MAANQLNLFMTRRFLPLFITQFFGALNNNVFKNALILLITFRIADLVGLNSQLLVAMAAGFFILPFFLFSATAGQLADKYEKSRMISVIKFIEIMLMVFATVGFYFQNTCFLMFVLFALGTQATFFGPLKYAILPEHLHENELIAGNGLIEAGTFISILFGTILGGALILQKNGEYVISAIIMLVALAGWCSSLFIPRTNTHQAELKINYNFISETKNLLIYSKQNRDIFLCILGISWFWLFGATFLSELPVFAKNALHADQSVVILFLTIFSIGLAIGSVICNRLLNGKIHVSYVPFGVLGMSIFTIDLYCSADHIVVGSINSLMGTYQFLCSINGWRIAIDLLFIAIFGGLYTVPLYAMMQNRSTSSHRARIIAVNNVVNALFMVIAAVATAVMIKFGFTVLDVFLAIAISNGLVAMVLLMELLKKRDLIGRLSV
jgi:acyl-[acyl-carrier-protein]-phospholipid O-acyltransferase/long-chain-fatty-acid--[acyl-carrier-protein] ligase